MKSLLALLLMTSTAYAGGGSSTGGGHVRVCLTPQAAAEVKSTLIANAQAPATARDPFAQIAPQDILSVRLVDVFEQPALTEDIAKFFANPGTEIIYRAQDQDAALSQQLKTMSDGVDQAYCSLQDSGEEAFLASSPNGPGSGPAWNYLHPTPIIRGMMLLEKVENWYPTNQSLPLTADFDPKVENPPNCVFAQVARQTVYSERRVRIDYDPRLLARMSDHDIIALGIHEGVYNTVLQAPRFNQLKHPSVTTRQLTALLLAFLGATDSHAEQIAAVLDDLGYGPYDGMIRPAIRFSTLELMRMKRESDEATDKAERRATIGRKN